MTPKQGLNLDPANFFNRHYDYILKEICSFLTYKDIQSWTEVNRDKAALEEVSNAIKKARSNRKYEGSKWAHLIFEDLEKTLKLIHDSLETLNIPSFSPTTYLERSEDTIPTASFVDETTLQLG